LTDAPPNFTNKLKSQGEQLKIAPFDMTKIMEHQQKNLEAMTKSWQAMAGTANEIGKKQREIFEAAVKDFTAMVQEYKPGSSPQEIMAKQAEFAKKAMEAAIANTRDIAELVQKSSAEAFKIVQERMKESYDEMSARGEKKPSPSQFS
jgi:phasin family protein